MLKAALGEEAQYLAKVIPNLAKLLGGDIGQREDGHDCVDAQKRLQFLLCRFVDVISSYSGAPIVLFLDDVQWSDQASVSAIQHLDVQFGVQCQEKVPLCCVM